MQEELHDSIYMTVKKDIQSYLLKGTNDINSYQIVKLDVVKDPNIYHISIYICNPGLVLGGKDITIDGLIKFLTAQLGSPVHIHIDEFRFWD